MFLGGLRRHGNALWHTVSPSQSAYWRGVVLYSICEWLGIPRQDYEKASKRIHTALKKTYGIDSFSSLSVAEFEKIASITRMWAAREHGFIIPEPDEEGMDVMNMSMRDFLIHKKLI